MAEAGREAYEAGREAARLGAPRKAPPAEGRRGWKPRWELGYDTERQSQMRRETARDQGWGYCDGCDDFAHFCRCSGKVNRDV